MVETRRQRAAKEESATTAAANNNIDSNSEPNSKLYKQVHLRGRSSSISIKDEDVSKEAKDNIDKLGKKIETPDHEVHLTVRTPKRAKVAVLILILLSYLTFPPGGLNPIISQGDSMSVLHVWYYGWITAVSTGLGVLPLIFVRDLDKFYIGVSNAVACGMMIGASYSLIFEGITFEDDHDTSEMSSMNRTIIGVVLGLLFILGTKDFLDKHEELKVGSLGGADAKKVLLIIFVMTLHSFSEGIGVGVSFGGSNGPQLGKFISASLAVHNIPEGLAVAIVLLPRKVSKLTTSLWCIVTSLPQPLMAVPSYLFVSYFIPVLPVGLGFAGGAMAWVAIMELLIEAYEDTDAITTAVVSTVSLFMMMFMQQAIKGE